MSALENQGSTPQPNRSQSSMRSGSRSRKQSPLQIWLQENRGLLPLSLVGLLLPLGIGWLSIAVFVHNDARLRDYYRMLADEHLEAKEFDQARFDLERMLWLNSHDDKTRFKLATVFEELDQKDRYQGLIGQLAPLNEPGYAPAHLVVAKALLADPELTPQKLNAAESHLRHVLNTEPNSLEAQSQLGTIYTRTGRLAEARTQLSNVVNDRPEFLLQLAVIERALGNDLPAETYAEKAQKIFEQRLRDNRDDQEALKFSVAAATFLQNFGTAEGLIQGALAKEDSKELHKALATIYLARAERQMADPKKPASSWLALLEKAIQEDPNNPAIVDRFYAMMVRHKRNDQETQETLKELLAKGDSKVSWLFMLGLDAWMKNQHDEARQYWEDAYKLAPDHGGVANNLAFAIASSQNPDLPRALDIINQALKETPLAPDLLATRGRVFTRMERWKEALADLEKAVRSRPDDVDIHKDLADTYLGLGLPDMAATHRKRAENSGSTPSGPSQNG